MENTYSIETIEALKHGDAAAFERIYHALSPKLTAFALKLVQDREEAVEVVQEVFVKLWERKHFLDPQQNLDGYLFRMAKNLVYNKARHRVHAFAYTKYLADTAAASENAIEDYINHQELDHFLREAYMGLPPMRQQVFVMSRMEGLSNGEIAEALQTSHSNIENHINKALRDIRKKFAAYTLAALLVLPILQML